MRKALQVAQRALEDGEVPVGCVLVLRDTGDLCSNDDSNTNNGTIKEVMSSSSYSCNNPHISSTSSSCEREYDYCTSPHVIISHGANQVNATRDATRHAECIAIDRVLTGGLMSDQCRLPQHVIYSNSHEKKRNESEFHDEWVNIPQDENHWKNRYGWKGRSRWSAPGNHHGQEQNATVLFSKNVFSNCDLYVTCEPCIMVSHALLSMKIHLEHTVYCLLTDILLIYYYTTTQHV